MNAFPDRLLEFVRVDLLQGKGGHVDLDTYLFDDGLIDSLMIVKLIAFVEIETGRNIPDALVVMKNFRTVRTITECFSGPLP